MLGNMVVILNPHLVIFLFDHFDIGNRIFEMTKKKETRNLKFS
jgi:hypothetical protein